MIVRRCHMPPVQTLLVMLAMAQVGAAAALVRADEPRRHTVDAEELSKRVIIHRDSFGTPHVFGEDDASTIFGFGYVQAEDFLWQVEDAYLMALGRYCEAHGPQGLNSDLLNRAFEIVPRSERDFAALDDQTQQLCTAFVAGFNFYLDKHPEKRPQFIKRFQPWYVLALHRHTALELSYRLTGLSDEYLPRRNPHPWTATGSNGWAISGARTASGQPMLLAAPHMPYYGFAQLAEAHLRSGGAGQGGWNFTGAHFYGSPVLAMGHNERLGWTLVSNKPDIADVWRVRFTNPDRPLDYEFDGGWRTATEWTETVLVRKRHGLQQREFTFRKTHHGPIVACEEDADEPTYLAARISGLYESVPMRQSLRMMKSRDLTQFRAALATMQILYMNVVYADCDGNIMAIYNGRIPRRNPKFDWSKPVDGADPATDWLGVHALDELPQVLNPAAGFVQNCNSTPAMTTDGENPALEDFPSYMIGDAEVRNRRSLRSLEILRGLQQTTFDQWQAAAFDTQVYWARHELPRYAEALEALQADDPKAAAKVRPYLSHLLAWDARITADSTAATLCHAWYEQMYGSKYPGEKLHEKYRDDPVEQLRALVRAADRLRGMHGTWKIPYGELYRLQRQSHVADLTDARFDDDGASLPTLGGHGPMGVAFTQYYTPSVEIPLVISQRRRYAMVGAAYIGAYEFAKEGVRGASLVPYGASGDRRSPHYFDQAKLLSERRLKPAWFTEAEVLEHAKRSYRPGE